MRIEQFTMEREQSLHEHHVDFNLSESGVRPLTPRELLQHDDALAALLDQPLIYTQTNGTPELRARIAALHPGATADHVTVTNGGSEANFVTTWRLVEPGDDVVVLVPNYMQIAGLARAFGATVKQWPLVLDAAAGRWRADLAALETLVTPRTKVIAICTPNNPTGTCLTADELDGIGRIAARHGSWVVSDEIYRGTEASGQDAPSMWGRYDRVIVTGGLAKAYGLPGTRIGWLVAPPDVAADSWAYHDYTSIAPGALSDYLARTALAPETRARLLARTRGVIGTNLPLMEAWLQAQPGGFSWVRPEAGAFVFARYHYRVNSTMLATRLREQHRVLVVPGDHFGMDGYLRLGCGEPADYLRTALDRLQMLLRGLPPEEQPAPRA